MNLKEMVEKYAETKVLQEEIDVYYPQAERKLQLIIQREGDHNGERRKPYYIAMLLAEIINIERFSAYCSAVCRERFDETKESIQQNAEMLPQTNIIISQ